MVRFNHVFNTLLVLAALCAFIIPARITDAVRGNLKVLFYPVSWPTSAVLGAVGGKISPRHGRDDGAANPARPRSADQILQENQELRVHVANLTGQLAKLQELDAQRETVGEVRTLCKASRVLGVGADIALRQSLHIGASTIEGVRNGMPVLYGDVGGGGVAGVIDRAQLGGSVVQLITDRGFRVSVGFARFTKSAAGTLEFTMIATDPVLAEGDGKGEMWIRNLPWQKAVDVALAPGDWVIIRDDDWPDVLQRYRLGRVESVDHYARGPAYAEIKIAPSTNLLNLREVMVMVKQR